MSTIKHLGATYFVNWQWWLSKTIHHWNLPWPIFDNTNHKYLAQQALNQEKSFKEQNRNQGATGEAWTRRATPSTHELAGEIQASCNASGAEVEKLVEETHVAEASEEKCKKTAVGCAWHRLEKKWEIGLGFCFSLAWVFKKWFVEPGLKIIYLSTNQSHELTQKSQPIQRTHDFPVNQDRSRMEKS